MCLIIRQPVLIFQHLNFQLMKLPIITAMLALCLSSAFAQDFRFAKPTSEEINLPRYQKDTSANAVVLNELGAAHVSSSDGNIVFEYYVKIKIFNSKGFGHGNVEIPLMLGDANSYETIRDLKGVTYYLDQNNVMQETALDLTQVFSEKKAGKYHDLKKFALPNLRDGCVIEYKYTIESPYLRNFRQWDFQTGIPKVYSEFTATIPANYRYNVTIRGPLKLTKNTGVVEKECFQPGGGYKSDCSKITYGMADIPAFIEEDFMTAASNYKSAIYFELSDYVDMRGGKHILSKEWKDVDRDLKTHEWFGSELKKTNFFETKMSPIIAGKTSQLEKAQSIYQHMQNWFKWNNYYAKYTDQGLKKAYENRSGSSADINLALVTAIRSVGILAEPVILSTRANGTLHDLYPVLADFDYVICQVTIDGQAYLLDATDAMLPFGLLPLRCLNERGRLMSFDKPSKWIELTALEKEKKTIALTLKLDANGTVAGNIDVISGGYEAYNKRKAISKFSSPEDYVEDLDEQFSKIKFTKFKITNLDSLEKQLVESYHIEIKSQDDKEVSVSPFFLNRIATNPFKLPERTYPVDMGTLLDSKLILNLTFPKEFEPVEIPRQVAVTLPEGGGKLIMQYAVSDNVITGSYNLQFNKSIYYAEDYQALKEFYYRIIQAQQADLTFRKKI